HVLRMRRGDELTVLDGAGREFLCTVENFDRDKLQLAVRETKTIPAPPCPITLLQAIPKGKIIESIIQKATELGVARIVPILSERVVTQLSAGSADRKAEKLQQVAIEAVEQCGAPWLPRVDSPVSLQDFIARKESCELPPLASLHPGSRHPRGHFQAFQQSHRRLPQSVCVWIGPEGDFTAGEVAAVELTGALPITLGPLVLRVET